ncbi:NrdH-like glutaredoxin [Rhodococcus phage Mbo4]|uniref:NrdH-like glutaredoxin n=2 Tax=root TaxID=1 RepID=A0A9E7IH52_9CAUD|nr:glutaredoxin domain-containing protein [Rhodococcus opacus]YP_010755965.1 NrdH-like glutaredoxin [Rhodococcus phage Mbo4]EKT83058.1 glutaredoxin-like protein NrdH [Rhodococcus opacus M213]URG17550.1 NrdH-like glutaredoxin [Rhodococcus phage Mbo4]
MSVTVYSSPACMPCRATKRKLDELGVEYTSVDLADDPTAADDLKKLGHLETPVVLVRLNSGVEHWSGHRPDRLTQLAGDLAAIAYLAENGDPA